MTELEKIESLFRSVDIESIGLSIDLLSQYCQQIKLYPTKYYFGTILLSKHFDNSRRYRCNSSILDIINALKGKDYKQFYYKVKFNPK